jgi:LPS sulfotransferase NodH
MDTGYERKFDLPPCPGPRTFYMIATVPRTGSTYLSHLLWGSGCLGVPLEYLNFDPEGPYGHASGSPEAQHQLWRDALERRTTPNGVFGLKCFPVQMAALQDHNPRLLADVIARLMRDPGTRRIVYLGRRDRAAHTVSFTRAALSGVWREEQEADLKSRPEYSETALTSVDQGIDQMTAMWERTFRQLQIEPLRIWYEDVVARPEEAVAQVAHYLGVAIDPAAAIAVPPVKKQTASELAPWTRRYAQWKAQTGTI